MSTNFINNFSKFTKWSIILSLLPALFVALYPGKIALITVVCSYFLIFIFVVHSKKNFLSNYDGGMYVKIFQIYNIIVLIRGLFNASSDEDWRIFFVNDIPIYLFIHFSLFLAFNQESIISVFSSFLSYGLVICIMIYFIPYTFQFGFPKAISPIYILIFLIPYLSKKYTVFIIGLTAISFFSDLQSRSNLINLFSSLLILTTFLFRNNSFAFVVFKQLRNVLLIGPIVLLILGLSDIFNIFLIGDYISSNDKGVEEVLADSRTGIYTDVFNQLNKDDSVIFGLGASGKTETYLVDLLSMDLSEIYSEGRRGTESGMLNYIQWGGIVGGLLYFLLFVKGSYYGIYKSNNWFCVMLGIWVAYKGFFAFIEDRPSFSISSIFIFFVIGICLNKNIRQMTDIEIKIMFEQIIRKTILLRFLNTKYRTYLTNINS